MILKLLKMSAFAIIFIECNIALANDDFTVNILGPSVVCPNEENIGYNASVSGAGTINSYTWTGAVGNGSTATASAGDSGTFTVSCTVTADNGSATGSTVVNVFSVSDAKIYNYRDGYLKKNQEYQYDWIPFPGDNWQCFDSSSIDRHVYDNDKPNQDWWITTDKLTSSSGLITPATNQDIP